MQREEFSLEEARAEFNTFYFGDYEILWWGKSEELINDGFKLLVQQDHK